jgi:hypothetical protein
VASLRDDTIPVKGYPVLQIAEDSQDIYQSCAAPGDGWTASSERLDRDRTKRR